MEISLTKSCISLHQKKTYQKQIITQSLSSRTSSLYVLEMSTFKLMYLIADQNINLYILLYIEHNILHSRWNHNTEMPQIIKITSLKIKI